MPDRSAVPDAPPAVTGEQPGDGEARPHRSHAVLAAARRVISGRPARWGFALAAVSLGCYAVVDQWPDVHASLGRIGLLTAAGALLCVLAAMAASMQSWRALLTALGSPLPTRAAARVMFLGQLGKYVPGSIWPVLAQMELGTTYRVPRRRSASASMLSMIVAVLTGLLTALVTLPFVAGRTPYLWAFLAAPPLLACLYPRLLNYGLDRLFRLARRPPLEQPLTARAIAGSVTWALAAWICYGVQLWLLVTRVGGSAGTGLVLSIGTFAFAWCVGFLAVFAPAGAGVREVLLVALLAPVIGTGAATAVALVSRGLTTISDLLAAGVAAGYARLTQPRPDEPG